jgi:hypothetical protein
MSDSIFFVEDFPKLVLLTTILRNNYQKLLKYTLNIYKNKKFSEIERDPGMWDKEDADKFLKNVDEEWIKGPHPGWYNYILMRKKRLHVKDWLTDLLTPFCPLINMCGLSYLSPEAEILPHIDHATTFNTGQLAYHFNIIGKGSIIKVEETSTEQIPGQAFLFDSGVTHSVKNGNQHRILLYIDLDLNEVDNI